MCESPAGGLQEIFAGGLKLLEIGKVPSTLIGCGIELEMDLVVPVDEAHLQGWGKPVRMKAVDDSFRQPQAEEIGISRAVIEPGRREVQFPPNILGIGEQPFGQGAGAIKPLARNCCQDTDVFGSTLDQPKGNQGRFPQTTR